MAYLIATWFYAAVPLLALGGILLRRKIRRSIAAHAIISTIVHGAAVGLGVAVLYAVLLRGHVAIGQFLVAAYAGIAMVSVLRLLNWSLLRLLERLLVRPGMPASAVPSPAPLPRRRVALASVLRALLLLLIGIPYVTSLLLVFRIKTVHEGTPKTILDAPYEQVAFTSADGVRLSGWWIPATRSPLTDGRGPANPGCQTVIFCPGLGADQASQLFLVRELVPNGYNVLSFDFRGTGQSGGQFTTFGDLERLDVLAAVHWLRHAHPDGSARIFGLGESTGAAALLAAAADDSADGQAISAVAVYNPYANLPATIQSLCTLRAGAGLGYLAAKAALPLAGWQLGTKLTAFSPARDAERIWPRPLLVIAGTSAGTVPAIDFEQSRQVYDHAQPPKFSAWLTPSKKVDLLHDHSAALDVRIFFAEARAVI